MPTGSRAPRRLLADARQQRRALQPDLRRVDRASRRRTARRRFRPPASRTAASSARSRSAGCTARAWRCSISTRCRTTRRSPGRNYNYAVTLPVQDRLSLHADRPAGLPGDAEPARDLEVQRPERAHRRRLHRQRPGRAARAAGLHRQHQQVPAVVQHVGARSTTRSTPRRSSRDLRHQPEPPRDAEHRAVSRTEQRASARPDLAAQISNCTLGAIAIALPGRRHRRSRATTSTSALQQIGTPFFENGRILLPPQLNWGGTRIGSVPPSLNFPGWLNINRIQQGAVSMTKVQGSHTLQGGLVLRAQLQGAEHRRQPDVPGRAELRRRHQQPARNAVSVLERRARRLLDLRAGVAVHRGQLLLQQHRVVPAGQLEGEPRG